MSTTVEGRSIWCYFGETCVQQQTRRIWFLSGGGLPVSTVIESIMIHWEFLYKSALCLPKTMSCLS